MARETRVDANFQMLERVSVALAVMDFPSGILGLASKTPSRFEHDFPDFPGLRTVINNFKEEAVIALGRCRLQYLDDA